MPYRKILADNLLAFRKSENLSQEEISSRADVSKDTISLIERERSNVRLDILEKIASYTGLTIPELFTEKYVEKTVRTNNKYE
ncbi:MAG: helix-turn-helix transcriptional regulator [Clostridia bacterium]|nr:helix-turn-helix transcriptional regulator [Clostridia bacterium]